MTCACCAQKDVLIAELEAALAGAIYVTDKEARRLSHRLGISKTQAHLVALIYHNPDGRLTAFELEQCLPSASDRQGERTHNIVSVMARRIREQLGPDFLLPSRQRGYGLTAKARTLVAKILKDPE